MWQSCWYHHLSGGLGCSLGEASGAGGTGAGLTTGSAWDSWPPHSSSGSLACGCRRLAATLLSPGGVTALHSQFSHSVSKELCQSKNSHIQICFQGLITPAMINMERIFKNDIFLFTVCCLLWPGKYLRKFCCFFLLKLPEFSF